MERERIATLSGRPPLRRVRRGVPGGGTREGGATRWQFTFGSLFLFGRRETVAHFVFGAAWTGGGAAAAALPARLSVWSLPAAPPLLLPKSCFFHSEETDVALLRRCCRSPSLNAEQMTCDVIELAMKCYCIFTQFSVLFFTI